MVLLLHAIDEFNHRKSTINQGKHQIVHLCLYFIVLLCSYYIIFFFFFLPGLTRHTSYVRLLLTTSYIIGRHTIGIYLVHGDAINSLNLMYFDIFSLYHDSSSLTISSSGLSLTLFTFSLCLFTYINTFFFKMIISAIFIFTLSSAMVPYRVDSIDYKLEVERFT